MIAVLIAIDLFFAWRYSNCDIDPDYALFALWGRTGAVYGKDFVDCKTPFVHTILFLISKITKGHIAWTRAVYYFITGVPALVYYLITDDFAGSLVFTVLIHSGWFLAFHGNVGDIPGGLILIALAVNNQWVYVILLAIATLYDPKLIVMTGLMVLFRITETWLPAAVVILTFITGVFALWYFKNKTYRDIVYSSVTVPMRMLKNRINSIPFMPFFTAQPTAYFLPYLIAAVYFRLDIMYWLPIVPYIVLQFYGKNFRQNHFLPLVAFIAAAGMPMYIAIAICIVDLVSSGFYFGDLFFRYYPGISKMIKDTRMIGEWLRDKPGTLWVESMYTEIYLWANKKPQYGIVKQIEIASVATERWNEGKKKLKSKPPDWLIIEKGKPNMMRGYHIAGSSNYFDIWSRL